MTKKTYYTDAQIDTLIHEIIRQLSRDSWRPDYIVGITRGGLIPAVKLSQYLNVPLETLKISLRGGVEGESCESNCWMADDAYEGKKILVVDDINDTGATLTWLKQDWALSAFRDDPKWDSIWNESVRFAVLFDNVANDVEVNYVGKDINKVENDEWIVFPWESWW